MTKKELLAEVANDDAIVTALADMADDSNIPDEEIKALLEANGYEVTEEEDDLTTIAGLPIEADRFPEDEESNDATTIDADTGETAEAEVVDPADGVDGAEEDALFNALQEMTPEARAELFARFSADEAIVTEDELVMPELDAAVDRVNAANAEVGAIDEKLKGNPLAKIINDFRF